MRQRWWTLPVVASCLIAVGLGGEGAAQVGEQVTRQADAPITAPGQRPPPVPIVPAWKRLPLGAIGAPAPGVQVTPDRPPGVPAASQSPPGPTLGLVAPATAGFSAVGVTWAGAGYPSAISVAVRPRLSGGWAPWRLLVVSDREPIVVSRPAAGQHPLRAGTELAWTGPASGIEVSVTVGAGAPKDIGVDLIDPQPAVSDATASLPPVLPAAATAALGGLDSAASPDGAKARIRMPLVTWRSFWRADERQLAWQPEYSRSLTGFKLQTVTTATDYQQSDVPRILRSFYQYEGICRGWGDLGFAVLVDEFGRIWEGRAGGVSRPVVGVDPAAIRIMLVTGQPERSVPRAMIEAAGDFLAWRMWLAGQSGEVDPWRLVTVSGDDPRSSAIAGGVRQHLTAELAGLRSPTSRQFAYWDQRAATWRLPAASQPALVGEPGDEPVPADYDGDGTTDLATFTPDAGRWRYLASATGITVDLQLGAPGESPVPADYDGDGAAEPATWSAATGQWRIGSSWNLVSWGQSGDTPLPGDYDGDGRADLAVWRPAEGTWLLRGIGIVRWGSPWHIPVPADYDGDGVIEPACWSPVSHRWFVANAEPVTFGEDGDLPEPGPAVRGGRAELAVIRAKATGYLWLALGSQTPVLGTLGERPLPVG